MFDTQDLRKSYDDLRAVDGVSRHAGEGETVGLSWFLRDTRWAD
jgi:ABC-type multidrug transport system ATPase subunit